MLIHLLRPGPQLPLNLEHHHKGADQVPFLDLEHHRTMAALVLVPVPVPELAHRRTWAGQVPVHPRTLQLHHSRHPVVAPPAGQHHHTEAALAQLGSHQLGSHQLAAAHSLHIHLEWKQQSVLRI